MNILGSHGCSVRDIVVGTIRSGREIDGVPEWNVVVNNHCNCTQSHIKFACIGFQTKEPVDPAILFVRYNTCLLIRGSPLAPFGTVKFSYAWDPPFLLRPSSTVVGPC